MKSIRFEYGKQGLNLKLQPSWNVTIIKPVKQKPLSNPIKSLREAIQYPSGFPSLHDIIKNKEKIESICIVVSDATRPVPSYLIIDAIIEELNNNGLENKLITILIATGLHHPSNEKEIKRIVGEKYYNKVRVVNHIAKDNESLQYIGYYEEEIPVLINRLYIESDLKILTGYVEPHFFFGFSGGKKSICPGIAGKETIMANHSAKNIASPFSRFGIYESNPMAIMSTEIAKKVGTDFVINVCINEFHKITKIATGDIEEVHRQLVKYQLEHIFTEIDKPFDIVVCGNGGYPLDLNLYQAVKSMAIGEIAVKQGGTIISVNECSDGIGIGQDEFKELLFSGLKSTEIYDKVLKKEIEVPDQWEIQVLTRVMQKAKVYVISKLKENEIGNIGLKYAVSVEEAISNSLKIHGKDARILILPNGPQILPKLR
ncbi:MAG: nickel-dependent lactate racemase [Candidatus Lokiarchaeota archaeon]|nr:nickel-dependent lactate racemase [Candidatus Lokiarchaeota archaeon]